MKSNKIILIALLIFTSYFTTKAQVQIEYDTCSYLNKYAGEWRYTNGQDTIRIYLKMQRTTMRTNGNDYDLIADDLWGWQEYKQGNTIIQSDYGGRLGNPFNNWNNMKSISSITLSEKGYCSSSYKNLVGSILDYSKGSEYHPVRVSMSTDGNTMYWHQEYRSGNGLDTGVLSGMTLPQEFTLIRQ